MAKTTRSVKKMQVSNLSPCYESNTSTYIKFTEPVHKLPNNVQDIDLRMI